MSTLTAAAWTIYCLLVHNAFLLGGVQFASAGNGINFIYLVVIIGLTEGRQWMDWLLFSLWLLWIGYAVIYKIGCEHTSISDVELC